MIPRVSLVPIPRLPDGVGPPRLVYRESRPGERVISVIDALDGRDRVEPGPFEGRVERRLEFGPGVKHRRREHVSGDSTDGIELHVHGRHSKPAGAPDTPRYARERSEPTCPGSERRTSGRVTPPGKTQLGHPSRLKAASAAIRSSSY